MSKVNQLSDIDNFDIDVAELRLRPRNSTLVNLPIPDEVLNSLQTIASDRNLSLEALLKLYIGKGLRQDLSQKRIGNVE